MSRSQPEDDAADCDAVAIQGGHITITKISVVPGGEADPEILNQLIHDQKSQLGRFKPSLAEYAKTAIRFARCRTLIGTRQKARQDSIAAKNSDLWWTEVSALHLEQLKMPIDHVMTIRHRPSIGALTDLQQAVQAYKRLDGKSSLRVFVLIGDLAMSPSMRKWKPELFLPSEYRALLSDVDYEVLLESKCRNVGKRRLLDRILKRSQRGPKVTNQWFETTGAMLIEDEQYGRVQLVSAPILDLRAQLNTKGPISLLYESKNATCALILTGMLEHFSRTGFSGCVLFFDRRDDPYIRMKVGDACAAHGVLTSWLEKTTQIRVRLHTSQNCVDEWSSTDFLEKTEPSSLLTLSNEVQAILSDDHVPLVDNEEGREDGALSPPGADCRSVRIDQGDACKPDQKRCDSGAPSSCSSFEKCEPLSAALG